MIDNEVEKIDEVAEDTTIEESGDSAMETVADEVEIAEKLDTPPAVDYEKIIEEDLREIRALFPEAAGIASITELENPLRYAALRDLGLSAREAYLATSERRVRRDNRSHLVDSAPKSRGSTGEVMTREELRACRSLFDGLSDAEIQSLYKKVTLPN